MAYTAIDVKGGLIADDMLDRLGASPEELQGQRATDFGTDGVRLSDEIQSAFSDAKSYWDSFQRRQNRSGPNDLTGLTRNAWVLPLLELLGYGNLAYRRRAVAIAGNSYPISHRPGDSEDAPPVHIVAFSQDLDRRPEGGGNSPHGMVQDYLNRDEPLWGIVTNGQHLRLLRETPRIARPTYIEFDLEAIFDQGLYADFVIFWRLCHHSRLPQRGLDDVHDCLLECYRQQSLDEGDRVREGLRDGVEEALRRLGTGFLSHPKSAALRAELEGGRLDPKGFYRELLQLVYRLLFLMVAEERGLLFLPETPDGGGQKKYINQKFMIFGIQSTVCVIVQTGILARTPTVISGSPCYKHFFCSEIQKEPNGLA